MKHIEILNLNLEDAALEDCSLYPVCPPECCAYCPPKPPRPPAGVAPRD